MSKPFTVTIENGIAELILNAPPVNAFNSAGWFPIAEEINTLGQDNNLRVIIIAAESKIFSSIVP